jgi:hypothetical protein
MTNLYHHDHLTIDTLRRSYLPDALGFKRGCDVRPNEWYRC